MSGEAQAACERASAFRYLVLRDDKRPRTCETDPIVCAAMESCADAVFHLLSCGACPLDGEEGGVPCEEICGREP